VIYVIHESDYDSGVIIGVFEGPPDVPAQELWRDFPWELRGNGGKKAAARRKEAKLKYPGKNVYEMYVEVMKQEHGFKEVAYEGVYT
jgi:hypothetical protein